MAGIFEPGEEFVKYLKEERIFKERWKVKELKTRYMEFESCRRFRALLPFRSLLIKMVTSTPTRLYVVGKNDLFICGGTASWLSHKAMANLLRLEAMARGDPMKEKLVSNRIRRLVPTRRGITITCASRSETKKESEVEYNHVGPLGSQRSIELLIKNGNTTPVTLKNCTVTSTDEQDYTLKADKDLIRAIRIDPGMTQNVTARYAPDFREDDTEIIFTFMDGTTVFNIMRMLKFSHSASVEPPSATNVLKHLIHEIDDEAVNTIDGEKPGMEKVGLEVLRDLPREDVPQRTKIVAAAWSSRNRNREVIQLKKRLKSELCFEDYAYRFDLLLHLEEIQCRKDVARYNGVFTMTTRPRGRRLLYLEVPGLAEKRPSVLRGDHIYARIFDAANNRCEGPRYKGYVHDVESKEVGIGFHKRLLQQIRGSQSQFYIEFTMNAFPMQAMHRAVKLIKEHSKQRLLLFPPPRATKEGKFPTEKISFFNRRIAENLEQKAAVENIVHGKDYTVYVIFGPPGTGKTVTLVEAIQQTLLMHPGFHLIVSAPSNSACDLLTKRLLENDDLEQREILRLHALSRRRRLVDDDNVKLVSNFRDSGSAYLPSKRILASYRIIVCTTITASRIASAKFPTNHFNRVFVDEAGQAMEPEVITSLAGILADNGKVVIAGDPKQLGPVVRSPIANGNGLEVSYLERLMRDFQRYQPEEVSAEKQIYDVRYITKLLQNYRSHRSIIEVPNKMFYKGELQAKAPTKIADLFCRWRHLPAQNFPVIFAGVQGRDDQESNSPSYFNACEVEVVKRYLDLVLDKGMQQGDIGVITPYRKQVEKIRKLRAVSARYKGIKIGSVEEFQGEERSVIIISTVRSDVGYFKRDHKFQLGFLRNSKRFNVAVTRAKSLLIVVGNPKVLRHDTHWKAFLKHCLDNDAYKNEGVAFTNASLERGSEDRLDAILQESDDEN